MSGCNLRLLYSRICYHLSKTTANRKNNNKNTLLRAFFRVLLEIEATVPFLCSTANNMKEAAKLPSAAAQLKSSNATAVEGQDFLSRLLSRKADRARKQKITTKKPTSATAAAAAAAHSEKKTSQNKRKRSKSGGKSSTKVEHRESDTVLSTLQHEVEKQNQNAKRTVRRRKDALKAGAPTAAVQQQTRKEKSATISYVKKEEDRQETKQRRLDELNSELQEYKDDESHTQKQNIKEQTLESISVHRRAEAAATRLNTTTEEQRKDVVFSTSTPLPMSKTFTQFLEETRRKASTFFEPGTAIRSDTGGGGSSSSSSSRNGTVASADLRSVSASIDRPVALSAVSLPTVLSYIEKHHIDSIEATLPGNVRKALKEAKHFESEAISRKHVRAVMCSPHGPFQPCISGDLCTCKYLFGFVMMAYISEDAFQNANKTGRGVTSQGICYLCWLTIINREFFTQKKEGHAARKVITRFHHKIGVGEYGHEHMIRHVTGCDDQNAVTPLHLLYTTGIDNCHGLTHNIRLFKESDYVVEQRTVSWPVVDGASSSAAPGRPLARNSKIVLALRERDDIIFIAHNPNRAPLVPVKPFTYFRHRVTKRPSTCSVLRHIFSTKNSVATMGLSRLRNMNSKQQQEACRSNGTLKFAILPVMWGWTKPMDMKRYHMIPRDFTPMLFELVFCKDLRKTAASLEKLLHSARIFLPDLAKRRVLNVPVDFGARSAQYLSQMQDEKVRDYRLYYASLTRCAVLETLLVIYPEVTTSDKTVHRRLRLLRAWNADYEEALGGENGDQSKASKDSQISNEALERLAARPLPYHMYDFDSRLMEIKSSLVTGETPLDYLLAKNTLTDGLVHNDLMSGTVRQVRASGDQEVINNARLLDFWKNCVYFKPEPLRALIEDETSSAEERAHLLRTRYSISFSVMLRVNDSMRKIAELRQSADSAHQLMTELEQNFSDYCAENDNVLDHRALFNDYERQQQQGNSDATRRPAPKEPLIELQEQWEEARSVKKTSLKHMYNLRLFAYTHLDLSERIIDHRLYTDEELSSTVHRPRDGVNQAVTHLEEAYPYDTNCPHSGMLPDLLPLLMCTSFIDNTSAEVRGNNNKPHTTLSMLRKLLPKCCQCRLTHQQQALTCHESASYRRLTVSCLRMTLLGAYEHAAQQPTFELALAVHKFFGSAGSDEKILNFIEERSRLAVLAMREAIVFWIRNGTAYRDHIIGEFPNYVLFEQKTLIVARLVRTRFAAGVPLSAIENALCNIYATEANTAELEADPLARQIRNHGGRIFRRVQVDRYRAICGHIRAINTSRERARGRGRRYVRPELHKLLQLAVKLRVRTIPHGATAPEDFDPIACIEEFNFGVDPDSEEANISSETLLRLRCAFKRIEYGNKDQKVQSVLGAIAPLDWELVDLFFNMLSSHFSVNFYPLGEEMLDAQMKAIRSRYEVPCPDLDPEMLYGEPDMQSEEQKQALRDSYLNPAAYSLVYTYCCNCMHSYYTQNCDSNFFGSGSVCLDPHSKRVYCHAKRKATKERRVTRSHRATYTRLREHITVNNDQALTIACESMVDRTRTSLRDTDYRYKPQCGIEPALMVPLPGLVVQITEMRNTADPKDVPRTDAYTICVECGGLCGFSRRLYGPNGFTCGMCEHEHLSKFRIPNCAICDELLRVCDIKKELKNMKLDQNIDSSQLHDLILELSLKNWPRFMLIDDREQGGDGRVKPFFVCTRCFKCNKSNFDEDIIYTVSDLCKAKHSSVFEPISSLRNGAITLRKNDAKLEEFMNKGLTQTKKKRRRRCNTASAAATPYFDR